MLKGDIIMPRIRLQKSLQDLCVEKIAENLVNGNTTWAPYLGTTVDSQLGLYNPFEALRNAMLFY